MQNLYLNFCLRFFEQIRSKVFPIRKYFNGDKNQTLMK